MRFFFFSSRRRHTRCSRDWSSDVCSSDLRRGESVAQLLGESIADVGGRQHATPERVEGLRRPRHARRSEEHTSELQSRLHLVCRLLLEKKKNTATRHRLKNVDARRKKKSFAPEIGEQ